MLSKRHEYETPKWAQVVLWVIVVVGLVLPFVACAQPPPQKEKVMNINSQYAFARHVSVSTEDTHATGFILATNLVLTCFHALQVDSDIFVGGKLAKVVAVSTKYDFALLAVETVEMETIQTSVFNIGEKVFYVGDPGKHRGALIQGYVADFMEDHIYIDARTVSGASGSAVYNQEGFIGMLCSVEVSSTSGLVGFGVVTPAVLISEALLAD